MQVMLMIHTDEAGWDAMSPAEQGAAMGAYSAYVDALRGAGVIRGGERLKPSAGAHTLRLEGGTPRVLDGPYAETKEQLAGFFLLEVADMTEALRWAARCPGAQHGTIELREVWTAPMAEGAA